MREERQRHQVASDVLAYTSSMAIDTDGSDPEGLAPKFYGGAL